MRLEVRVNATTVLAFNSLAHLLLWGAFVSDAKGSQFKVREGDVLELRVEGLTGMYAITEDVPPDDDENQP